MIGMGGCLISHLHWLTSTTRGYFTKIHRFSKKHSSASIWNWTLGKKLVRSLSQVFRLPARKRSLSATKCFGTTFTSTHGLSTTKSWCLVVSSGRRCDIGLWIETVAQRPVGLLAGCVRKLFALFTFTFWCFQDLSVTGTSWTNCWNWYFV